MGTARFEPLARAGGLGMGRPLKERQDVIARYKPKPQTSLPSFKTGGKIRRTGPLFAHKGEFVLPKGVQPTPTQIMAVRKRGGKC